MNLSKRTRLLKLLLLLNGVNSIQALLTGSFLKTQVSLSEIL